MTNYQEIWPSGLVPIGPWSKVKVNKLTMNGRRSASTIMMQSLTLIPLYPQNLKVNRHSPYKQPTSQATTHHCIHSHFAMPVTGAEIFEQEIQHSASHEPSTWAAGPQMPDTRESPTRAPLTAFSLLSVSAEHSCAGRCGAVRAPVGLIAWRGVALVGLRVGLCVGRLVAIAVACEEPVALRLRVHHAPDGAQVWLLDNNAAPPAYSCSWQWLACKFVPL